MLRMLVKYIIIFGIGGLIMMKGSTAIEDWTAPIVNHNQAVMNEYIGLTK